MSIHVPQSLVHLPKVATSQQCSHGDILQIIHGRERHFYRFFFILWFLFWFLFLFTNVQYERHQSNESKTTTYNTSYNGSDINRRRRGEFIGCIIRRRCAGKRMTSTDRITLQPITYVVPVVDEEGGVVWEELSPVDVPELNMLLCT